MTNTKTANLSLTEMMQGQKQADVIFNENMALLDVLVQGSLLDRDLSAPPASPAHGAGYIVASSPAATGAWVGHENKVVVWITNAWHVLTPKDGWRFFLVDEKRAVRWNGASWQLDLDDALETAGTNDVPVLRQKQRTTTATAANGAGFQELAQIENGAGTLKNAVALLSQLADVTDGSEKGQYTVQVTINGTMVNVGVFGWEGLTLAGGWNTPHLIMNGLHFWVDSAQKLRSHTSAPTSDTDGGLVGLQS